MLMYLLLALVQEPDNSGPIKLVSSSVIGGSFDDELVGVAIAPDRTIVLAGNTVDLKASIVWGTEGELKQVDVPKDKKGWRHPSTSGFVAWGSKTIARFGYGQATIKRMRMDEKGTIYLLGEGTIELAGAPGKGTFIAKIENQKITGGFFLDGIIDFDIDGEDVVVLTGSKLVRYTGGQPKWSATWKAHGTNRPGGVAVMPKTGIAVLVGYGMTHTGKEPYKDPYAYAFDREGKQIWGLWNPDPSREKGSNFGGNGLMADTTGRSVGATLDGKAFVMFYSDGGNSVMTRDPADPDKPLDPVVHQGVFQKGPGHGFKGASKTSCIFRLDPATGKLEKGTWMCAWIDKSRANSLSIDAAAADKAGRVFVVGGSASGCPTQSPWYQGEYKGGGFLSVFDKDFKMIQSGYFPTSSIRCVAVRDGIVVIAGSAEKAPLFKSAQKNYGGGIDGYFAVFKTD